MYMYIHMCRLDAEVDGSKCLESLQPVAIILYMYLSMKCEGSIATDLRVLNHLDTDS